MHLEIIRENNVKLTSKLPCQYEVYTFTEEETEEEWGAPTVHLRMVKVTKANYTPLEMEFTGKQYSIKILI